MKHKYPKLTQAARGQECTIQIHPYCSGNTETTVFCHAPCEDKGMGFKSPDWWGADGCSSCHDIVDHRVFTDLSNEDIFEYFMRAIYRTLKRRIEEQGLIHV